MAAFRNGGTHLVGIAKRHGLQIILALGLATAAIDFWMAKDGVPAASVLGISLTMVLLGIVVELTRETSLLGHVVDHNQTTPCWTEQDTLNALRNLSLAATADTSVAAVWGALPFSNNFDGFLRSQLTDITAREYEVDRWVDVSKVDFPSLRKHLQDALTAIQCGRYRLHLIPNASFGALIVNDGAAINYPVSAGSPSVIGMYGTDPQLTKRVRRLIEQLENGCSLPTVHPTLVTIADLESTAREYYEQCGRPVARVQ